MTFDQNCPIVVCKMWDIDCARGGVSMNIGSTYKGPGIYVWWSLHILSSIVDACLQSFAIYSGIHDRRSVKSLAFRR